jgi:hypothetical protein
MIVMARHHTSRKSYVATGSGTTYGTSSPANTATANTHDSASSQANLASWAIGRPRGTAQG